MTCTRRYGIYTLLTVCAGMIDRMQKPKKPRKRVAHGNVFGFCQTMVSRTLKKHRQRVAEDNVFKAFDSVRFIP